MQSELEPVGPIAAGVLARLVTRYEELADTCYRVLVSRHDERGRFRRGHRARRPHPALVKKVDLDRDLARLYRKFFGPAELDRDPTSTSASNSRPQGSETRTGSAAQSPSSWET